MAKLTEKEAKKKRIDELVKAVLSLQEIANKLMPIIGKVMDGMMSQNKSIASLCETVDVHTTSQENMLILLKDVIERIAKVEAELKIPSNPKDKVKSRITYIS